MHTPLRHVAMLRSFPWVEAAMYFLQSLAGHVRINLSGADTRMSEHFLDGAEVSTVLQQVRGEAVSEHVRSNILFDAATFHPFFDMQPHGDTCKGSAAAREKNCARRTRFDQPGTCVPKIFFEHGDGRFAHWHNTFLVPLPYHIDESCLEVELFEAQRAKFREA